MWIRIRAVIIEDEPLAAQYLAALLDDTCQAEVVDTAADSESGLRLCAELRPDVVERAKFVTGETLTVDGGQHAGRW
jgi:chemotaxis response regulator CheB